MTGNDERIIQLEAELEKEEALNRLLLDTDKSQNNVIRHFRKMVVTLLVCSTIIICTMVVGFFWYEGKFDVTTTTTSMETDGANANINNVTDGGTYNDNAVHSNK